jgi:hypothetical protein
MSGSENGKMSGNETTLTFGGRDDVTYAYMNGGLDEVRISNIVRSAAWISTEYNNQSSPSTFYSVN